MFGATCTSWRDHRATAAGAGGDTAANGTGTSARVGTSQLQKTNGHDEDDGTGASCDGDGGGGCEAIERGVRGLTAEEERREYRSLTADEIAAVQADLIGLSILGISSNAVDSLSGAANCAPGEAAMEGSDATGSNASARKRAKTNSSPAAACIYPSAPRQQVHDAEQQQLFGRVAEELGRLPPGETAACRRALQVCPDQVLDPRRIQMFLDYAAEGMRSKQQQQQQQQRQQRQQQKQHVGYIDAGLPMDADHQVQTAASQMAKYWKAREHMFNNAHAGTAYLPMTQTGALTPAGAMHLATRRTWQLLPQTDTSGRSIVLFTPSRRDYTQHTYHEELAVLWYLIETVLEDPIQRKHGLVLMVDLRGGKPHQSSKGAFFHLKDMINILPTDWKAYHFCFPPAWVHRIVFPVVKRLSPREIRLRMVMHYGTTNEVLTSLSGYCLPRECVPVELGGQLVLDTLSWAQDRLAHEMRLVEETIAGVESNLMTSDEDSDNMADVATATTCDHETNREDGRKAGPTTTCTPPMVDRYPSLSDKELYGTIMEAKHKAHGRKGDRRMTEALVLCLESPDLPHLDAILQGGFDFSHLTREELEIKSSRNIKDADGITLKQRLDQLSRRLRQAKKWIRHERETGKLLKNHVEPRNIDDEISARNEAGILVGTDNDGAIMPCRRDSFDEAFEELPGIGGLSGGVAGIFSDDDE